MTKTTNYQLKQWDKTDRIKMDDFNIDNQRLETALDSKVPMTVLYDETLKEKTGRIDLTDVPQQHWEQYSVVILTVTGGASYVILGGDAKNATHRDLLNPSAQAKPYLLQPISSRGATMLFFPHGNRNHLQAISFDSQTIHYSTSTSGYTLPIIITGSFNPGERIRVYGIL